MITTSWGGNLAIYVKVLNAASPKPSDSTHKTLQYIGRCIYTQITKQK